MQEGVKAILDKYEAASPLPMRFWDKVSPEPNSGCWLWEGGDNGIGYGRIWDGDRVVYAHRYAYERLVGPIEDDLVIDHLCRTPSCVNPQHMEPVTKAENFLRAPAIRERVESPTCTNGHLWSEENTYIDPNRGGRTCRTCRRLGMRKVYARQRNTNSG